MTRPRPTKSTPEEVNAALSRLPGWKVLEQTPSGVDHPHTELHCRFKFASFRDATHFMLTASRFIELSDHHPRWQNLYADVEVWITTGDLGHNLSVKDFALAEYLQNLYHQYQS